MGSEENPLTDEEWIITVKQELSYVSTQSTSWSICRVPSKLLTTSKDAYNPYRPQIISIGPFHYGSDKLQVMEDHKRQYMLSLLMRTCDANETLDAVGMAIPRLDEKVRSCYAETIGYSRHELAKILLLDACFILELFLRFTVDDNKRQSDPIFTTSWMISTLQRDLLLLENQIPFFVLERLYEIIARDGATGLQSSLLLDLALTFFKAILTVNEGASFDVSGKQIRHLLDLIHICLLPSSKRVNRSGEGAWEFIQCATSLDEAGVEFVNHTRQVDLFDLSFHDGVFKIPRMHIHDSTDSFFRNLIAFEQCFDGNGQYMTSYALLMDRLIDTRNDAELLGKKGIIENNLGDSEDVSALFNNICKQVVLRDFHFAGLCDQVNTYSRSWWHRNRASLKRDYFKNPWTTISLFAAFVLLSLSTLQTLYSMLSYYSS